MRRAVISLTLTLWAILPVAGHGQGSLETFKVSDDKFFSNYRPVLIDYLRTRHIQAATHACILGEKDGKGAYFAWVIWPAGHQIILWEDGVAALARSRRILDLNKDVVAADDDVNGSDYLVTRQWVGDQEDACGKNGLSVDITPAELK
ncbi:hypothetical protein GCM10007863_38380 [Dyella mobilis]|nr:hypothetical protein GCM10007863_38380 [Dyella mobilis]